MEITLSARVPEKRIQRWITKTYDRLCSLERTLSRFEPASDVSLLNSGMRVRLHRDTHRVLAAARRLQRLSNGAFNVRSFGVIDLGGIAKGYAVDEAVKLLRRLSRGSSSSGLVNAGGDLRRWGGTHPLPLAVRADARHGSWLQILPTAPAALSAATSSLMTRAPGSTRLTPAAHVRTATGARLNRPETVTVIATSALWADALTKIVSTAARPVVQRCLGALNAIAIRWDAAGKYIETVA